MLACLAIILAGGAVQVPDVTTLRRNITLLSLARSGEEVVGVYTIKNPRPAYAAGIMWKSKTPFDPQTAELGYAAIKEEHQGKGLSTPIRTQLIDAYGRSLFGVTSNPASIHGLLKAGFIHVGETWTGRRGDTIGLYLRNVP